MMTVDDLILGAQGKLFCGQATEVVGVCTNSKAEGIEGHVFIPLKGENHDAHKFVGGALERGVSAVLFSEFDESWKSFEKQCAFIQVDDTLKALQDLSSYWRKKFSIPVIAITGSNGKTTTKDFTSQILSRSGKTCSSHGSYNNHWGVPLTLLELRPEHQYMVVEMGMNHPGEISALNAIAQPNIAAVTTVGRAHMGFFKNVSEIAQAKEEIYKTAPENTKMVFNLDNNWTAGMFQTYSSRDHMTYSLENKDADVFVEIKERTGKGFKIQGKIGDIAGASEVFFWGEHNISNLLAAMCLSFCAGVSPKEIWGALPDCHTGWGRNQWVTLKSGADVLFDAYNANPDSFLTLAENLEQTGSLYSNKIGVFGEMLELGDGAAKEHEQLGERLALLGWDKAFFIGPSAAYFRKGWARHGKDNSLIISNTYEDFLVNDIESMLNPQTLLVVKGSRGLKLERVVTRLKPQNFSV